MGAEGERGGAGKKGQLDTGSHQGPGPRLTQLWATPSTIQVAAARYSSNGTRLPVTLSRIPTGGWCTRSTIFSSKWCGFQLERNHPHRRLVRIVARADGSKPLASRPASEAVVQDGGFEAHAAPEGRKGHGGQLTGAGGQERGEGRKWGEGSRGIGGGRRRKLDLELDGREGGRGAGRAGAGGMMGERVQVGEVGPWPGTHTHLPPQPHYNMSNHERMRARN